MHVAPCRHNTLPCWWQEGSKKLRHYSSGALKKKTKNKPTTLCRDDKTLQCRYNAPCLSSSEKEEGKRGTVSFITAKGKGKASPFARRKVFLGLCLVAPGTSGSDLSITDVAAVLTDSHHEGQRGSLTKRLSVSSVSVLFFLCAFSATMERFSQVKPVLI